MLLDSSSDSCLYTVILLLQMLAYDKKRIKSNKVMLQTIFLAAFKLTRDLISYNDMYISYNDIYISYDICVIYKCEQRKPVSQALPES